jgi:tRNA pseudouridine55 synthase
MSEIHGLLLLNKPIGLSSHDVVAKLRKILNQKSVGHAGTLDPLAEGLMVCLLGEGTKISQYLLEKNKTYEVKVLVGVETETLDITGLPLKPSAEWQAKKSLSALEIEEIVNVALKVVGDLELEIPKHSAKKVDGKKLYELARNEVDFVAPKKIMSFWGIEYLGRSSLSTQGHQGFAALPAELASIEGYDVLSFRVSCSKGGFIRSWVSELGKRLGKGATMAGLKRVSSEPYDLDGAVTFAELEERRRASVPAGDHFLKGSKGSLSLYQGLCSYKSVRTKGHSATLMRNGQISHELRSMLISRFDPVNDQMIQVIEAGTDELIAMVGLEKDTGFVVRRVFRY